MRDLAGGVTSDSLEIIGAQKTIGSPDPKVTKIPIPGSDVTLDFTEAFGGVHYNNRTITLVFLSLKSWSAQMAQDSTVKNALHGQKMYVLFSDDPGYFWTGRVNVGDWEYYKGAGRCTVTIDAEPYKHKVHETSIYVNPGNNKNLYPYYDSFEDVSSDEVSYSNSSNLSFAVITTTVPKQGTKVLRCTTNADVSNSFLHLGHASKNYGQICLPPGEYVASFYVIRQSGEETLSMRATVYGRRVRSPVWADGSLYKAYNGVTASIPTSLAWPTRVEIPFTVDSAYPYVCIRLQFYTPSSTYYIDCMQIERTDDGHSASEWVAYSETEGTSVVSLQNSDREVVAPSVSATASANLAWDGYSVSISESSSIKIPQLLLERGRISVSVQSTGLVSFIYREGSL